MIHIAARATIGVKIPDHKNTRRYIQSLFINLGDLNQCLTVRCMHAFVLCPTVPGKVNITCDGEQASNANTRFAVTGHWTEETFPGVWEMQSGLLGITDANVSHNGLRLGRALSSYQTVKRLQLPIRCGCWISFCQLAHVINLAMQAFLAAYCNCKARRYDPVDADTYEAGDLFAPEI
jgi:hypothetical protein